MPRIHMSRPRIPLVLAAIVVAALVGYFTWQRRPDITKARQAASAIRAIVQKDPRFIDVTVGAGPNATIYIVAPAKLSPGAKATLEQLVKNNTSGQRTNLVYAEQVEYPAH